MSAGLRIAISGVFVGKRFCNVDTNSSSGHVIDRIGGLDEHAGRSSKIIAAAKDRDRSDPTGVLKSGLGSKFLGENQMKSKIKSILCAALSAALMSALSVLLIMGGNARLKPDPWLLDPLSKNPLAAGCRKMLLVHPN